MAYLPLIRHRAVEVIQHRVNRRVQVVTEIDTNRSDGCLVPSADSDRVRKIIEVASAKRKRGSNRHIRAGRLVRLVKMLEAGKHVGDVRKHIVGVSLVTVPQSVRHLLGVGLRDQVWARSRRTLVDGRVTELSTSYFPESVAARAPQLLLAAPLPPGGVVAALEKAGFIIVRTMNEVRARIARDTESLAFGIDPQLSPLEERVVLELTHGTYGQMGEPVEAVVSVRQAREHVLTFETKEQPGAASGDSDAAEALESG